MHAISCKIFLKRKLNISIWIVGKRRASTKKWWLESLEVKANSYYIIKWQERLKSPMFSIGQPFDILFGM